MKTLEPIPVRIVDWQTIPDGAWPYIYKVSTEVHDPEHDDIAIYIPVHHSQFYYSGILYYKNDYLLVGHEEVLVIHSHSKPTQHYLKFETDFIIKDGMPTELANLHEDAMEYIRNIENL